MATNIEVNELKINKMSEATLSAMENAGEILPNQIFFTYDSKDTMTGLEQVEVIYDMDGGSQLDWDYSGGLQSGTTITGKDFSKYKYLRVYISRFGRVGFGVIDLNKMAGTVYEGVAFCATVESSTQYLTIAQLGVHSSKTSFYVNGFYQNGSKKTESGYVVYKIEGVY